MILAMVNAGYKTWSGFEIGKVFVLYLGTSYHKPATALGIVLDQFYN